MPKPRRKTPDAPASKAPPKASKAPPKDAGDAAAAALPKPVRDAKAAKPPKRQLPVVAAPAALVPCLTCALCCSYIAVAIDGPINAKAASEILWHLYHRDVSVYRDGDDEWMVQFESRCRHLQPDNACGIYEQRPHICRTYSEQSCEVNSPDEGITFYAPDAFLSYLSSAHKRIYREVMRGHVPSPEHLGPLVGPRHEGPAFEARFRTLRSLRAAGNTRPPA